MDPTIPYPYSDRAFQARLHPAQLAREPLIRAIRLPHRPPAHTTVIDATAGLGRDLVMIWTWGACVHAIENNATNLAHLETMIAYMQHISPQADLVHVHPGDACVHLAAWPFSPPDVIYLDPMFSHRSHALPKKAMAALQARIPVPTAAENAALWEAAWRCAVYKVVVKRYKALPALGDRRPNYVIAGSRVRYDVYTRPLPSGTQAGIPAHVGTP